MRQPNRAYRLVLIIVWLGQFLYGQIDRVEPPFWWSNMQNPELEVVFYGAQLSDYQVSATLPILRETRTSNPNYLFVNFDLKALPAGVYAITFSHPTKPSFSIDYEIRQRRSDSSKRKGFDASDVVYLIMPDRFANGDPSNDTVSTLSESADRANKDGRHGGDLQGIIDHIDYIKSLGATTLWLTPVCEDNDPKGSYHTYAQSDLYAIDARFGSNLLYKQLSEKLHQQGMKLIMDYVTNHWGRPHWMFQDPPEPNFFNQHPTYTNTNHRKEIVSDPYATQKDRLQQFNGWFVPSMPDLNQQNPLLLNYLTQNAIWWIEFADLDGLRIDTYPYNHPDAMAQWAKAIMEEYPNFNMVGESWVDQSVHSAYWQKDSPIAALQGYNSHLPSVMDFSTHFALTKTFNEKNKVWSLGTDRIYRSLQNDFLYPNVHQLMLFLENHDTNRINDTYPNFNDYKNALKVLLTLRGIPQIYYGTEIGMTGKKSSGDGDIRRDFPGGWAGDIQNAFEENQRTPRQKQYFDFTQLVVQWRKSQPAIHRGTTLHYVPDQDLYVYFRIFKNERILVLVNNSSQTKTLDWKDYQEGIANFNWGQTVETKTRIDFSKPYSMVPENTLIIELKNDE